MERLLNMILRRLMNKGINSGMRAMSKRGQSDSDESQEARKMNRQGQQNTRGLRQATRMLRRISKF
ncbi:hypothetical protein Q4555_12725 [Octadecabacter sp. 1_MG-2023]|uniref:hypothetical protein n=1 Tax=unclassified Octadecabacter TaxID=196158 RepID=UPI001C07FFBE|nr:MULTISPECIES: hypothetical protein [unclassified Octadecabacter]MBU2993619.1 hypothetical protein [Octadecabacter sp. B2R22]MDO6735537.1 hypothetical protein [Octadecabacter sp. 1_MG-2023]